MIKIKNISKEKLKVRDFTMESTETREIPEMIFDTNDVRKHIRSGDLIVDDGKTKKKEITIKPKKSGDE